MHCIFCLAHNKAKKFIKELPGLILFITNQGQAVVKAIAKDFPKKLIYIEADNSFTVK